MNHGQSKTGCFSGSGLRNPQNIAPRQNVGDGLLLNGRRCGVAHISNRLQYVGTKSQVIKAHRKMYYLNRPKRPESPRGQVLRLLGTTPTAAIIDLHRLLSITVARNLAGFMHTARLFPANAPDIRANSRHEKKKRTLTTV